MQDNLLSQTAAPGSASVVRPPGITSACRLRKRGPRSYASRQRRYEQFLDLGDDRRKSMRDSYDTSTAPSEVASVPPFVVPSPPEVLFLVVLLERRLRLQCLSPYSELLFPARIVSDANPRLYCPTVTLIVFHHVD